MSKILDVGLLVEGWKGYLMGMKTFDGKEGITFAHHLSAFTGALDWARTYLGKHCVICLCHFGFSDANVVLKYKPMGGSRYMELELDWPEGEVGDQLKAHFIAQGLYPTSKLSVVEGMKTEATVRSNGVLFVDGFFVSIMATLVDGGLPVTLSSYIPLKQITEEDKTISFVATDYRLGEHHVRNGSVDSGTLPFSAHPLLKDVTVSIKLKAAVNLAQGTVRMDASGIAFKQPDGTPVSESIATALTNSIKADVKANYQAEGGISKPLPANHKNPAKGFRHRPKHLRNKG